MLPRRSGSPPDSSDQQAGPENDSQASGPGRYRLMLTRGELHVTNLYDVVSSGEASAPEEQEDPKTHQRNSSDRH